MAYTMVSMTGLGFDLVRLPGGSGVADVLLSAMRATDADLAVLAGVHPGPSRAQRWDDVQLAAASRPALRSTLQVAGTVLEEVASGQTRGRSVLTMLAHAPLGDVQSLDRVLRHDLLEHTWVLVDGVGVRQDRDAHAGDVLADAAASAYCSELLDHDTRRALAGPFLAARREGAVPVVAAPGGALGRLLADVATWSTGDCASWRTAVDLTRSGGSPWADAMHEASWAAHLSDRTRSAAEAQLHGVQAFVDAGLSAQDAASGSWNALSGVLQALSVADLLGEAELQVLLRPWLLARGVDPR